MTGKEKHKDGQPHIHFISSEFNLRRDYVLNKLSKYDYSLPSTPHLDLNESD